MSFDFEAFDTPTADFASPISPLPPPPLRIHHFLLCGVVTAIYLTWWRHVMPPAVMQQFSPVALGFNMVYNVLTAIGFTLAAISAYWHIKDYADLSQPGVWLLLSYLIFVLPQFLNNAMVTVTGFDWVGTLQGQNGLVAYWLATIWYSILYSLLPLLFFVYCAWAIADTRPWRWVFIAIVVLQVLPVVPLAHRLLMNLGVPMKNAHAVPTLITAGVILSVESWAAQTDLVDKRARFWPHWAGLWLAIVKQSLIAIGAIATLLDWF